jgi:DNA-binding CsgD family transcriptional regulator
MTPRAVVVAHPELIAAEAIAAALRGFPHLLPIGVATSMTETIALGERADAVAIDSRLPGAPEAAARLRRKGVRVVTVGNAKDDDDVRVSTSSSVASLAHALEPRVINGKRNAPQPLTTRELEVLTLVSRGFSGKQIARHLGISPKTVENHKTSMFAKLRVPNQAAAVTVALANSYIS